MNSASIEAYVAMPVSCKHFTALEVTNRDSFVNNKGLIKSLIDLKSNINLLLSRILGHFEEIFS